MSNEPANGHPPEAGSEGSQQLPGTKLKHRNPFKSGFVPTGKRSEKGKSQRYVHKKNLLKHMLEVEITIQDLPTCMADELRRMLPGVFENIESKFTMRQVMELVQFQLLFSRSDFVKQDAINAIKDRVEGKPMQKVQVESAEAAEPTEFVLPNGRRLFI